MERKSSLEHVKVPSLKERMAALNGAATAGSKSDAPMRPAVQMPVPTGQIVRSGFIKRSVGEAKLASVLVSRYAVLYDDPVILFYSDEPSKGGTPKGFFSILPSSHACAYCQGVCCIEACEDAPATVKTLKLQAGTGEEAVEWHRALTKLMPRSNTTSPHASVHGESSFKSFAASASGTSVTQSESSSQQSEQTSGPSGSDSSASADKAAAPDVAPARAPARLALDSSEKKSADSILDRRSSGLTSFFRPAMHEVPVAVGGVELGGEGLTDGMDRDEGQAKPKRVSYIVPPPSRMLKKAFSSVSSLMRLPSFGGSFGGSVGGEDDLASMSDDEDAQEIMQAEQEILQAEAAAEAVQDITNEARIADEKAEAAAREQAKAEAAFRDEVTKQQQVEAGSSTGSVASAEGSQAQAKAKAAARAAAKAAKAAQQEAQRAKEAEIAARLAEEWAVERARAALKKAEKAARKMELRRKKREAIKDAKASKKERRSIMRASRAAESAAAAREAAKLSQSRGA